LRELQEEKKEQMMNYENEKNELEDYFTLWVHQMKLPIAGMKLLLQTEEEPDVKLLKSELFRIQQYTDMVLAYVRMNSISTDYVLKESELDDMIRQVIRKFSGEFIRKKLQLDFQETKKRVLTDEKWLVFVIEQVISNALKYTKKGGIKIYLKDEDTLVIEDTGIGIEASDCYCVFEKGYTGLNGRYDKKASGIGLYLCKTIMTNLSHKIWIESERNYGTKVMLSFPHNIHDRA
jgi:signal transduction histidine kinase